MRIGKLLFFVILSFIAGFIWGLVFSLVMPQYHLGPKTSLERYDQMVTVEVIRNGNNIWIVEHKTGQLIFEYNRFKEADKGAFTEYEDLLIEILSKRHSELPR